MNKKKSIGIVTIHNPQNNYGGALQCYALYEYLRYKGYVVEVIDILRPNHADYLPSVDFRPIRSKISFTNYVKGRLIELLGKRRTTGWDSSEGLNETAKRRFNEFNSMIKLSKQFNFIPDLYAHPPKYDIYIAGSDQLWNPTQNYSLEPYFLTFVKSRKAIKMSYGTSIGITDLSRNEKRRFAKWLSTFDHISVREAQAKRLLESFVDNQIERVPDPTFLLDAELWQKMAHSPADNNYILVFSLGKRKYILDKAVEIAAEWGYKVKVIDQKFSHKDNIDKSIEIVDNAGPLEFVGLIKDASLVLTDSFHCTVFSLITNTRNFYSYLDPSDDRGSRVEDLLDTFNLRDRILHSMNEIPNADKLKGIEIDHEDVTEAMKREQAIGRLYIKKSLEDENHSKN